MRCEWVVCGGGEPARWAGGAAVCSPGWWSRAAALPPLAACRGPAATSARLAPAPRQPSHTWLKALCILRLSRALHQSASILLPPSLLHQQSLYLTQRRLHPLQPGLQPRRHPSPAAPPASLALAPSRAGACGVLGVHGGERGARTRCHTQLRPRVSGCVKRIHPTGGAAATQKQFSTSLARAHPRWERRPSPPRRAPPARPTCHPGAQHLQQGAEGGSAGWQAASTSGRAASKHEMPARVCCMPACMHACMHACLPCCVPTAPPACLTQLGLVHSKDVEVAGVQLWEEALDSPGQRG